MPKPPPAPMLTLQLNGKPVTVPEGSLLTTALLAVDPACRESLSGEPRGPLCGMGICHECRVSVDGQAHVRACQVICREGMEVLTDA